MKVYKFGGASLQNADGVKNVGQIIASKLTEPVVVVASAMGKTTNALELLATYATQGQEAEAFRQWDHIRDYHLNILRQVVPENIHPATEQVEAFLAELKRIVQGVILLQDTPPRIFDRIMAYGELLSTTILYHHLDSLALPALWLDARELIITDANFKQADLLWSLTEIRILNMMAQIKANEPCALIVQGYIASTKEGQTTTLGREGSDFTAAIFCQVLQVEEASVWKDVPGIMSADPKIKPDAVRLEKISYDLAGEMTFFGAGVLHPKTIQPLRRSQTPLQVKSFREPEAVGTTLVPEAIPVNEKIYIRKKDQALLTLRLKDCNTITETDLSGLFETLSASDMNPTLMQRSALAVMLLLDTQIERIDSLQDALMPRWDTELLPDLTLHTYCNYTWEEIPIPILPILIQSQRAWVHIVE